MKIPKKILVKGSLLFFLACSCSSITHAQSPSKQDKEQAATLQVNGGNRQAISFTGMIDAALQQKHSDQR